MRIVDRLVRSSWGTLRFGDTHVPVRLVVFVAGVTLWIGLMLIETGVRGLSASAMCGALSDASARLLMRCSGTGAKRARMTPTATFVGLDIAKADFVVACRPDGTSWTAPNDAPGITATVDRVGPLAPSLIVLEAAGGYETPFVAALAAAGLPVVVANPRQVRDFAKATGQLAKTDRLDAHLLALFAERVQSTPRPLPEAGRQQLNALVTRRRQLLEELVEAFLRAGR